MCCSDDRFQIYNARWEEACGIEYGDDPQFDDTYDGGYPMGGEYEDGMDYNYGAEDLYDDLDY